MQPECRRDVCTIEATVLRATLEMYLRKHRFCSECRTKVQKAYLLLVEDPEPCKEKGYVNSLYVGIKRCIPEKHFHLQTKTEFVAKLIGRAEPELLGSRRERHAKTLEIAQEEVLTCVGICMCERLHKIHLRMREEECTCEVFAAVAVNALWRNFEKAVDGKKSTSEMDQKYEEISRKELKKSKRKRRKDKPCAKENNSNNEDSDEKNDLDSRCNICNMEECSCGEDKVKAETDDEERFRRCSFIGPNGEFDFACNNCDTESLALSSRSLPDGSGHAVSDSQCPAENVTENSCTKYGSGDQLSLERMLDDHFYCDETDNVIPPEEVEDFRLNNRQVSEEREQLRETLRKRFALLCATGLLYVPGYMVQSKITTN